MCKEGGMAAALVAVPLAKCGTEQEKENTEGLVCCDMQTAAILLGC